MMAKHYLLFIFNFPILARLIEKLKKHVFIQSIFIIILSNKAPTKQAICFDFFKKQNLIFKAIIFLYFIKISSMPDLLGEGLSPYNQNSPFIVINQIVDTFSHKRIAAERF